MCVSRLKSLKETAGPPRQADLDEVLAYLHNTVDDLRSLTFELSPPMLYDLGLPATLEWLAEHIQKRHGFAVDYSQAAAPERLDKNLEVILFRAARELLINARKHSRGDWAGLHYAGEAGKIRIIVEDNGLGFESTASDQTAVPGFGLFSIRERLRPMGGEMTIQDREGGGGRVVLTTPIKE
jgi:signal transduction histidine kinase